ncbi:hypothetical protein [Roseomonas elaeocarpi]|uniref:DUF2786 domain-containing protein n=1 Tax=Roseomonas elaeocarpi TaxID=907779 RepID=A0ABV6JUH8_9PROT
MQASDLAKLVRVLGLLGSEHDGERAAAAMAAHRLIKRSGLSWQQLLGPAQAASRGPAASRRPAEDPAEALKATSSRLRQAQRENDDLQRQIRRLRQRLEASYQGRRSWEQRD